MEASWSDLTNDVLEHIISLLIFSDRQRFGAVCHNWRLIAKQKHHRPSPELPWLVLEEDRMTKRRNFFSLSEQRHYSIDLPELYGQYICGSSHGWLFTVDIGLNGRLLNPFTRECYELPPFPPYKESSFRPLAKEKVYSSTGKKIVDSFRVIQTELVVKAVLSHDPKERPDFTVMVLFNHLHDVLALWRPGDADWTVIYKGPTDLSDAICFEGKFYVASPSDVVFEVELGPNPKIEIVARTTPECLITGCWKYLVNFKGQLLLIRRHKTDFERPTSKLSVAVINLMEGSCHELEAIDDLAMFIGNSSAVVVDPKKFPNCISNSIYYTDMGDRFFWQRFGHELGVYDMVNKTFGRFSPDGDVFRRRNAAITWFTPNM